MRPSGEDLAVVGQHHFHIRQRLADGARVVASGSVEGDDRAGLGEAVALQHVQPRRREEVGEVSRQRRAAHDEVARPPAEGFAPLRKHQPVGQTVRRAVRRVHRLVVHRIVLRQAQRPIHQPPLEAREFGTLLLDPGMNLFQHPRHGHKQRRTHFHKPGRHLVGGAEVHGHAVVQRAVVAAAGEDVRERQEREHRLAAGAAPQVGNARVRREAVERDVFVGEHHPLGRAGRTRRVEDRRHIRRLDVPPQREHALVGAGGTALGAKLVEGDHGVRRGGVFVQRQRPGGHHHEVHLRAAEHRLGAIVRLAVGHEQHPRFGVIEDVMNALGRGRKVDGHIHKPAQQRAHIGQGKVHVAVEKQRHLLAAGVAVPDQPEGDFFGGAGDVSGRPRREALPVQRLVEQRRVRVPFEALVERFRQGDAQRGRAGAGRGRQDAGHGAEACWRNRS